jgi:electron transfer flavoprotein beta subunit
MGADRAVIVSDPELRGSDALVTAHVLARAIDRDETDLVITGTESTDGYSGVVPQQIAELLEVPALTFARHVEASGDGVQIQRQTPDGYEVVASSLPALLSVTAGAVEPRYPTFKGIMQAKQKPIDELTASDLGYEPGDVGGTGSGQSVKSVTAVPSREAGEIVEDDGEGYQRIVALLEQVKVI